MPGPRRALAEAISVRRPGSLVLLTVGFLTAFLEARPVLGAPQGSSANWVLASLLLFLSPFFLIPLVFIPRGRRFRAALDEARAEGRVTPALTAAFGDPAVKAAHVNHWVVVVAVTYAMVARPF